MNIPLAEHSVELSVIGEPQIIKEIEFYPIKLLDRETRILFENIFMFSRSQMFNMNNISILERKITQPWLNVFLSQYQKTINPQGIESFFMLQKFLSLICHVDIEDISIGFKNSEYKFNCDTVLDENIIVQITKYISIDGKTKRKFIQFNGEEFNIVRNIIIEQNGKSVSYIDEWNASFEDDAQRYIEAEKIDTFSSFSDDIITYKELSKKTNGEIKDMTLFQFIKGYQKAKQIKDYEIYYPLVATGKIKFNKPLNHYSEPIKKEGRYDFTRQTLEDFKKNNSLMKDIKKNK